MIVPSSIRLKAARWELKSSAVAIFYTEGVDTYGHL